MLQTHAPDVFLAMIPAVFIVHLHWTKGKKFNVQKTEKRQIYAMSYRYATDIHIHQNDGIIPIFFMFFHQIQSIKS